MTTFCVKSITIIAGTDAHDAKEREQSLKYLQGLKNVEGFSALPPELQEKMIDLADAPSFRQSDGKHEMRDISLKAFQLESFQTLSGQGKETLVNRLALVSFYTDLKGGARDATDVISPDYRSALIQFERDPYFAFGPWSESSRLHYLITSPDFRLTNLAFNPDQTINLPLDPKERRSGKSYHAVMKDTQAVLSADEKNAPVPATSETLRFADGHTIEVVYPRGHRGPDRYEPLTSDKALLADPKLINKALDDLPPLLRHQIKRVELVPEENPEPVMDANTRTDTVRVFKNRFANDPAQIGHTMLHEAGHLATMKDGDVSLSPDLQRRYREAMRTDPSSVSRYATTDMAQDLAEAVDVYAPVIGTRQEKVFRHASPGRFAVLDEHFAALEAERKRAAVTVAGR